jgi:hypothetical protein
MLLDGVSWDPDLANFLLICVEKLYVGQAKTILDAYMVQNGFQPTESAFSPATNSFPAAYMALDANHGLFIGGGTENYEQGRALMEGYTRQIGSGGLGNVNSFLATMANGLLNQTIFQNLIRMPTVVYAGHSLGGALAVVLAAIGNRVSPQGEQTCITFGAPRSGGIAFDRQTHVPHITRWMNSDDPVPLVPPTVSQCPPLALVTTLDHLRDFADQRHLEGGQQLNPDGTLTETILPTVASISPTTDLAAWLVSLYRGTTSPHQTPEYRRRLALIPRLPNLPGRIVFQEAPAEVAPPIRPAELNREVAVVRQNVNVIGEAQSAGPVILPPLQIFRAVKIGKTWYTVFGNTVFAIGPRRRKAGLLAQAGNAFLRRLQRQSQVDPISLENAWDAYLIAAADPASGIRPTLRIGL